MPAQRTACCWRKGGGGARCGLSALYPHIVVWNPQRLAGPEATIRMADCASVVVKAPKRGNHYTVLLQARPRDHAKAVKAGVCPEAALLPPDLELQLAVATTAYHWPQAFPRLRWMDKADRQVRPRRWQEWPRADEQRTAVRDLRPASAAARAPDTPTPGRTLAQHTVLLANVPFAMAPESSIRKSVVLPATTGARQPTKFPLCADNLYTSEAMLEHVAWHAVQANAPAEDKEGASYILQGRAQESGWQPLTPSGTRPQGWHQEGKRDRQTPRDRHWPTQAGRTVMRPAAGPSRRCSPLPRYWSPWGRGPQTPRPQLLSWNLRNGLVLPDLSFRHTLRRRRGPAACTDREHFIPGMLPKKRGFTVMLQETGMATGAQEMRVVAALRDEGYITLISSHLVETGTTSRGGRLLTAVSSKYVAENEVLSFT